MRTELGKVLDADDSHRQTYRHLARFERKFDKYGMRTIEQLPSTSCAARCASSRPWCATGRRRACRPALAHGGGARRSGERVVGVDRGEQRPRRAAPRPRRRDPPAGGHRPGCDPGRAQRGGRHVGMSRFNWADGGFNSTSAPA
jgi:hypothetical protein